MSNFIITCEHAGNEVPQQFQYLFDENSSVLTSHRGWDPGAWKIAKQLSESLSIPLFSVFITRLLVETNRSLHHKQLFSEYTSHLDDKIKQQIITEFYLPHRTTVEQLIALSKEPVIHLSIHSFTPVLDQLERQVDIGLLFDPARSQELSYCQKCRSELIKVLPDLSIKYNEPYRGIDDGFTTYLRTKFLDDHYCGIEVEINQKYVDTRTWQVIGESFTEVIRKLSR